MTRRREVTKAIRRAAMLSAMVLLPGLCQTAFAQVTTQCPSTIYTAAGNELHLHLNSHWDPTTNKCEPNDPNTPSGSDGVQSCYDGEEFDPQGNRLNHLDTCAQCQIGTPGCFFAPPPDRPNIELLPGYNPFGCFEPYDPGGRGINPFEGLPDDPPPMMDFYIPWRWL